MNSERPLYVGYQPRAHPSVAHFLRIRVAAIALVALLIAVLVTMAQGRFANSSFEYGTLRTFNGIVSEFPFPTLLVQRPGRTGAMPYSRYLLVTPGKHGAAQLLAGQHGRRVTVNGTLIYRDDRTMVEIVPDSLQVRDAVAVDVQREELGEMTLRGEILDSKCYLGVMKPGQSKAHRGCAIRCLSGGIPALFLVQGPDGTRDHLLLAGHDGRALNKDILHLVAEPVEIRGQLERIGGDLLLRTEPEAIARLH